MAGEITTVTVTPGFGRNVVEVEIDHTDPNTWGNPPSGDFLVEYQINGGGFVTPANVQRINNHCIDDPNPVATQSLNNTRFTIFDPTIPQGATVEVRVTVQPVDGTVANPDVVTESAVTNVYPTVICLPGGPHGQTEAEVGYGTADGTFNISPCDVDSAIWEISTTPGGPYTPEPAEDVNGLSPDHTFTGLNPDTTYYYRARFTEQVDTNGEFLVGPECSFTTAAIPSGVGTGPTIAPPPFVDTPQPPMADVPVGYSNFVDWVSPADEHWRNGVTTEPWSCPLDVHEIDDLDCMANNADRAQKVLGPRGVPVASGTPFVLHADYNCGSIGRSFEEAKARAAHRLLISENLGLSRKVLDILQSSGASDITPTPGTAVSLLGGIGMLQQWLSDNIGAHGMIHAPIILGPYLQEGGQILGMGDVQVDTMGNRWAFGAAHGSADSAGPGDPAADQPDGTAWLYASGQFRGHRGETFFTPPDVEGGGIDRANNNMIVIAEREYVVWHECDVAAILVNVSCCC